MEEHSSLRASNFRAKGAAPGFKIAILGAAGEIGQPLSMLMKINPFVSVLYLYDVVNTPGVTADISHMDTGVVDRDFLGQVQLEEALTGRSYSVLILGTLMFLLLVAMLGLRFYLICHRHMLLSNLRTHASVALEEKMGLSNVLFLLRKDRPSFLWVQNTAWPYRCWGIMPSWSSE